MLVNKTFAFDGYDELIRKPLVPGDPQSFTLIQRLLNNAKNHPANAFSVLIEALTGITISQREGRHHWKKIVEHKRRLELKLCRTVNIKTAAIDYYDQLGITMESRYDSFVVENSETSGQLPSPKAAPILTHRNQPAVTTPMEGRLYGAPKETALRRAEKIHPAKGAGKAVHELDSLLERFTTPGYHHERLKEEMQRARRYKHALSVIMFNVDLSASPDHATLSDQTKDKVLSIIVKMINKAVRTVDILTRHSDNLFLLILPNTNKREALELAERLKTNICQRTNRIPELSDGIPITIAVGQCSKDDTTNDFIMRIVNLVDSGKRKAPNAVYTLE